VSPEAYRSRIEALGLTQEAAGELFGTSARSGQRWASEGPPLAVSMVLLAVGKDRMALNRLQKKAIKLRR
jgi:hypothetical protein